MVETSTRGEKLVYWTYGFLAMCLVLVALSRNLGRWTDGWAIFEWVYVMLMAVTLSVGGIIGWRRRAKTPPPTNGTKRDTIYDRATTFLGFLMFVAAVSWVISEAANWSWTPGRIAVVVSLAFLTLGTLAGIMIPGARKGFLAAQTSFGPVIRMMIVVTVIAAGAFAAVTRELLLHNDGRLIDARGHPADATLEKLTDFYYWHLVNGVPGRPLETTKIDVPYQYESHWVGVLVLTYTIIVILPMFAYVRDILRWRQEHHATLTGQGARSSPPSPSEADTSGRPGG